MKKTISINLAGLVYQIDEDAYYLLETYLEKVKNTFTKQEEQEEILNDIEHRFAELFSEKLGKRTEVVHIKMVEEAIETLGEVEDIDDENASTSNNVKATRKLFRSTEDKIFAGVLGGLSVYIGIEAIWLRLIFVILAIASVGVPVGLIYIVLWVVMPKAVSASQKMQMQGEAVNINNFQEKVKKNLNEESFKETGNRLIDVLREIVKASAKIIALALGAFTIFNIVLFSFVWFFVILFISFIGGEYISLVFNNSWDFLSLSSAVYFLFTIPSLMLVYFFYKAIKGQKIAWAKAFVIAAVLWFIALVFTMIFSLNNIKNFKTEAKIENTIDIEVNDSIPHLNVEFEKNNLGGSFNFSYKKGNWETNGFTYDEHNKTLKLNTIYLLIEASKDSTYSLIAHSSARGKNKNNAVSFLDNFTYKVEVLNGNTLVIPTTLVLENETKFRAQTLTYTLRVPVGSKIKFGAKANNYIGDVTLKNNDKKRDLENNIWLVNSNGLECLSCTQKVFEQEED